MLVNKPYAFGLFQLASVLLFSFFTLTGIDATDIDTDGTSLVPALRNGTALPDRTMVVANQRVLNPDPGGPML